MKKIIALLAASAMMLTASFSAFAAKTYPANSDAPKVTASYVCDEEPDEDGYYYVTVTFDLSDLGDLNATYASKKNSGLKLASFAISGKNTDELGFDSTIVKALSNINLGGDSVPYANSMALKSGDGFNLLFNTAEATVAYPVADSANKNVTANSLKNAVSITFYALPGTFTLSDATVSYLQFEAGSMVDGAENAFRDVEIINGTFTIPPVSEEPEKELSLTIAEGTIYENGTVWACEIANAVDGLAQLEATFKAGEATKSVITTKLGAWGGVGATEFNIGINTAKAGVVANAIEATITDGAGATATAEAAAN